MDSGFASSTRPGMTVDGGLLKLHCADGKTPLLTRSCAIAAEPATLDALPENSLARPRPSLILRASRASDPHSVADAYRRSPHRPLRLFAGVAGHARCACRFLFRRGLLYNHQSRALSLRLADG